MHQRISHQMSMAKTAECLYGSIEKVVHVTLGIISPLGGRRMLAVMEENAPRSGFTTKTEMPTQAVCSSSQLFSSSTRVRSMATSWPSNSCSTSEYRLLVLPADPWMTFICAGDTWDHLASACSATRLSLRPATRSVPLKTPSSGQKPSTSEPGPKHSEVTVAIGKHHQFLRNGFLSNSSKGPRFGYASPHSTRCLRTCDIWMPPSILLYRSMRLMCSGSVSSSEGMLSPARPRT
mmetsp:Transcript_45352/g.119835  ORF Transcript_45352/g.119835 Transcript_45352/m.119835 type:complete len:235 (+) Transcript_45352:1402-2106(+)